MHNSSRKSRHPLQLLGAICWGYLWKSVELSKKKGLSITFPGNFLLLSFSRTVVSLFSIPFVVVLNPCIENPCENGGVCVIKTDKANNFNCQCPDGFLGDTCHDEGIETHFSHHWLRERRLYAMKSGEIKLQIFGTGNQKINFWRGKTDDCKAN